MKALYPRTVRSASAPLETTDSLHRKTVLGELCEQTAKSSPAISSDTSFRFLLDRMCRYCANLAGNAREGINILNYMGRGPLCLALNVPALLLSVTNWLIFQISRQKRGFDPQSFEDSLS